MKINRGENLRQGGNPNPERVKDLQREMKKAGYWDGEIDGNFSAELDAAVRKFQKDAGLKGSDIDGQAGPETGRLLNEKVDAVEKEKEKEKRKEAEKEIKGIDEENIKLKRERAASLKKRYDQEKNEDKKDELAEKLYLWRRRLKEELKEFLGAADAGEDKKLGSIITPADKARWNTKKNVENLARVIMSEASVGNSSERTAVGYTVLNRMKRNGNNQVSDVWGAYAHKQKPTKVILKLAGDILKCTVADNSGGATHFYSPRSMPKEGQKTKGFDVGGGLEQTPGLSKKNYRPSWVNTFDRVTVEGVRETHYKFYRAPGTGKVR